jgi:hypothetical protein
MSRYRIQSHGDGYDLWIQDTTLNTPVTPPCEDTPEHYQLLTTLQANLEAAHTTPDMGARYKTLRHMETVRNYLGACITELLHRAAQHDQSKLESPEVEAYDAITHSLRTTTYGSEAYKANLTTYAPAIQHHYRHNRHHPEYHADGMKGMTLLDLIELLCDWKAATLRHANGNLRRSIALNQERFGYSDDLAAIFCQTAAWLDAQPVQHKADES